MHFKDLHLVECKQQQQDSDDNMVGIFSLIAFAESSKHSLGKHDQHLRAFKKNKKINSKGKLGPVDLNHVNIHTHCSSCKKTLL